MAFTTDIPRRTMNYVDSTNNVSFQVTSPEYILREQEIAGDNNSSSSEENIAFFKVEQLTFLWILFVLIVISNCLVLRVVLPARMRGSSRMNFFVMHLAIADLSNGLMCVLPDIIWRTTVNWYAGNFMCKTVKFFQEVVVFASTYVLVSLSLDRLDAIARPLRFTGSGTRARILVASAWIFSVIFSIPSLVLFEDTPSPNDESIRFCYLDLSEKWHWMLYVTLLAVSLFIIPAVIIIVCYTTIVYVIWKNSHLLMPSPDGSTKGSKRNKSKNYIRPTGSCAEAASTKSHSSATSSRGVIPKAKIKTIKMTFLIVLAFILCWSPFMIFSLLQVYGMIPNTHTMGAVATFFQSLAPLNSVANPVIYGIFNTRSCRNAKWRTRFVAAVPVVERIQPSGSQWDRSTRGSAKWMSQCAQARMRWDHAEYQDCPTFEAQSRKQNDRSSCATSRQPAVNGFKRNIDKHESCMF